MMVEVLSKHSIEKLIAMECNSLRKEFDFVLRQMENKMRMLSESIKVLETNVYGTK